MNQPLRVDFLRGIRMRAPGVKATRQFYETSWGLSCVAETEDALYFRGTDAEQWIYALREDDTYGIDYLHFGMSSRERIDQLYARLQAEPRVEVGDAPAEVETPGGGYGFYAVDPEGRRLRFTADVARHADAEPQTGKPRKISHVVMNATDIQASQAFYEQVLGFRASDYSADVMVFLRCTSEHHSIAFNRNTYTSINHVAFLMPSLDSFMRGIGRMRTSGRQPPAWGPGRHGPGSNTFAYFVSPSSFVIEYTSEVQEIDEATHQPKVWPRDIPEASDVWLTAGPPSPVIRAAMQGRPDPGWLGRTV